MRPMTISIEGSVKLVPLGLDGPGQFTKHFNYPHHLLLLENYPSIISWSSWYHHDIIMLSSWSLMNVNNGCWRIIGFYHTHDFFAHPASSTSSASSCGAFTWPSSSWHISGLVLHVGMLARSCRDQNGNMFVGGWWGDTTASNRPSMRIYEHMTMMDLLVHTLESTTCRVISLKVHAYADPG